jgi:hypothetical protein
MEFRLLQVDVSSGNGGSLVETAVFLELEYDTICLGQIWGV